MTDGSGDDIMARLFAIGEDMKTAGDFKSAARGDVEIGAGDVLPGFNLFDGEEEGNGELPRRGAVGRPVLVSMFPLVCIAAQAPAAEIAAVMRVLRRKVIRNVLTDAELIALLGNNGGMAYRGFVSNYVATDQILGRMVVRFEISYVLAPASL